MIKFFKENFKKRDYQIFCEKNKVTFDKPEVKLEIKNEAQESEQEILRRRGYDYRREQSRSGRGGQSERHSDNVKRENSSRSHFRGSNDERRS